MVSFLQAKAFLLIQGIKRMPSQVVVFPVEACGRDKAEGESMGFVVRARFKSQLSCFLVVWP